MANDNKKINELVTEKDDDPTAELEILSEPEPASEDGGRKVEAESEANTFDFEKLESGVVEADATISNLKSDLLERTESINKLQFDIEQLRSRWSGLEKELKAREEVTKNLTRELKSAHKKQSRTDKLLKKRDQEVKSLQNRLSDQEQTLQLTTQMLETASEKSQASEVRGAEIQVKLDAAREELVAANEKLRIERSDNLGAQEQLCLQSEQAIALGSELAASRALVNEFQQYIDSRKSEWQKQDTTLRESKKQVKRLNDELKRANEKPEGGGASRQKMIQRLESVIAERDELISEITQLREDSRIQDSAAEDNQQLAEQAGLLASQSFEIRELRSQLGRTEQYADELRNQLQDQLALADVLQSRQKHLEISLTGANSRVEELSNSVDELRASNALLNEEKTNLKKGFEKEVRQMRFELDEAQETIAGGDSLHQQLTSDLVDTREFNMNLEKRLNEAEEANTATIAEFEQKLARLETKNEELADKLATKDNAISALLAELTKRSETVESIGEIGDVIHDLDDRMSDQIDERSGTERERITRLLIGKIDGQKLRFPLFKNRLTIGRTGHNDIQLKAPYISRRHAVIVTDDDSTRIVDWGSKNGVYVNTMRIKEQVLRNGDIVTIGTADFKFEERPKR